MNSLILLLVVIAFLYFAFQMYQKNDTKPQKKAQSNPSFERNTTLHKIIENDNSLNFIVDDFESRKHAKTQDLEKSLGKALPNDVIWGVLQDIFLESFIKNHKVLLNCAYQQGLLVQKEKNYKQAIVHYAYGLYYLMNFYKADFRPMAHIIDYVSTETELIEMAQEKFINKIQRCVKYANLEAIEIKTIASKMILVSPLPYLGFDDFFATIEPYLFKKEMPYPNQSSGDLQSKPLEEWSWASNGDDEVVKGLIFKATLQSRTPLEVLKHHNEIFNDKHKAPPQYAKEGWEGMWVPILKTWRELGIDEDEMDDSTCSSDIGYLNQKEQTEYEDFLIKFHTISGNEDIETEKKVDAILSLCETDKTFKIYFDKHSQENKDFLESHFKLLIKDYFPSNISKALEEIGLRTIKDLKGYDIEKLSLIKGIGKATIEKLKPYVNAQ